MYFRIEGGPRDINNGKPNHSWILFRFIVIKQILSIRVLVFFIEEIGEPSNEDTIIHFKLKGKLGSRKNLYEIFPILEGIEVPFSIFEKII